MANTFAHLHNHSEYSLLDGAQTTEQMAIKAAELGLSAVSITDHGRMGGCVEFYTNCKKHGVKPILGMEAYITGIGRSRTDRIDWQRQTKEFIGTPKYERNNYHLILLAKNEQGYDNLCQLSTESYSTGFYQKPRIDYGLLEKYKDGLIVSSACFAADTMITTANGFKRIDAVEKGDLVLSKNGCFEEVLTPTVIGYDGDGYAVKLAHTFFPTVCTYDHKFLIYDDITQRTIWKEAHQLRKNDKCIIPVYGTSYTGNNIIHADDVNKLIDEIFVIKDNVRSKAHIKYMQHDITLSNNIMRLLGLWLADGSMSLCKRRETYAGSVTFSFGYSDFNIYYESFVKAALEELGFKYSIHKKKGTVDIVMSSALTYCFFHYLFKNKKSAEKSVSTCLMHISKDFDCELLYGYLLGDGYFDSSSKHPHGRVISASVSISLANDIIELWRSLGIQAAVHVRSGSTAGLFDFQYNDDGTKSNININSVSNIYNRKASVRTQYVVEITNKAFVRLSKHDVITHDLLMKALENAYEYVRSSKRSYVTVNGIEYQINRVQNNNRVHIRGNVYCLSTADHTFVCNNAVVHNCIIGEVSNRLLNHDYAKAREVAMWFKKTFGEDYYFEQMNHGLAIEQEVMRPIRELADELGIKVIATNDAHYTNRDDHKLQKTLMLISMHKSWADSDVKGSFFGSDDGYGQGAVTDSDTGDSDPIFETPPELYMKSYEEMLEALRPNGGEGGVAERELDNTNEIADKCNFDLPIIDPDDTSAYFLADYPIEQDNKYDEYEKSGYDIPEYVTTACVDEMHKLGHDDVNELSDFMSQHDIKALRFLMYLCERGIKRLIKPKVDALGEPLPESYWIKNPPKGFEVRHAHNSPDELWIKGKLDDGNTPDDILQIYRDRLAYEMSILCAKKFVNYFLIVQSYVDYTRASGSSVGPGRGCHRTGTMVMTPNGAKEIERLSVGDVVYDEKGTPVPVIESFTYDVDETLVDVAVAGGNHLDLTPDHKVKALRASVIDDADTIADVAEESCEWVPAGELQSGDLVYVPTMPEPHSEFGTVNISYRMSKLVLDDELERMGYAVDEDGNAVVCRADVDEDSPFSSIADTVELDDRLSYIIGRYVASGWCDGDSVRFKQLHRNNDAVKQHDENTLIRLMMDVFDVNGETHACDDGETDIVSFTHPLLKMFIESVAGRGENKRIPSCYTDTALNQTLVSSLLIGIAEGQGEPSDGYSYVAPNKNVAYAMKRLLMCPSAAVSVTHEDDGTAGRRYVVTITPCDGKNVICASDDLMLLRVESVTPYDYSGQVHDIHVATDNHCSYLTETCVTSNSGAGSLINYLTGITAVDPLPNDLMFERFLNPDRKGYPDIDIDFSGDFRDNHLWPHIREMYGKENTSAVAAYTYYWGKAAIKAAARVLFDCSNDRSLPESERSRGKDLSVQTSTALADLIDNKPKLDLRTELDGSNPALSDLVASDTRYQQVIELALILQGRISGEGQHASAYIVSPHPITNRMPLMVSKDERAQSQKSGKPVSNYLIQYDGRTTQDKLGYVKLDLLCINDLEVITTTLEIVKRVYGCDIDIENIPLDDAAAFQLVQEGHNTGLFQFDGSPVAGRLLIESQADRIGDWSAINALNRPGPLQMGYDKQFVEGKLHPESITYFTPAAEKYLKPTYGTVCVAEGTQITTINGYKNIEDIAIGDMVLSDDGQFHCVTNVFDNGVRETICLHTDYGEDLFCTPEHKVLTASDEWVEAQNLKKGDLIKAYNIYERLNQVREIEQFDWYDWFIGLFIADGHSSVASPTIACCSEAFADKLIEVGKRLFPSMQNIHKSVSSNGANGTTWSVVFSEKVGKVNGSFSADFRPNSVSALLKKYGLFHMTKEKKTWPSPDQYSFSTIIGMWEGDGCYKNKRLHVKYKHIAYGVYDALMRYGFHTSIYQDTSGAWLVSVDDIEALRPKLREFDRYATSNGAYIPSKYLRKQIGSCPSYKERKVIYKKIRDGYVRINTAKNTFGWEFDPQNEHYEWARVLNISPSNQRHVYDLTVEESHSYVANSKVAHNCFQESLMLLSQDKNIVGFTGGESDTMRKILAHKDKAKIQGIVDLAHERAEENGVPKSVVDKFCEIAVAAGSYSFNSSHSLAYALIAYRGAFLKAHFPEAFLAAMCQLKPDQKGKNKIPDYLEDARQLGVEVLPPNVNYSLVEFDVPHKGAIAYGLERIKGVGKSAQPIVDERLRNGQYRDFTDFCCRVPREVGKSALKPLIEYGALDGLGWTRKAMLESIDEIIAFRKSWFDGQERSQDVAMSLFSDSDDGDDGYSYETRTVELVPPFDDEYTDRELLRQEKQHLGMCLSGSFEDYTKLTRFKIERDMLARYENAKREGGVNAQYPIPINVADIRNLKDGMRVELLCVVSDPVGKRENPRMFRSGKGCSIDVYDHGLYEESRFGFSPRTYTGRLTVFSRTWETLDAYPRPSDTLHVTGRISVDKEGKFPNAVIVDTLEVVDDDKKLLSSMSRDELMALQSDFNEHVRRVSDPSDDMYMIPVLEFDTGYNLQAFLDSDGTERFVGTGRVEIKTEDDKQRESASSVARIVKLKQTRGMVRWAERFGAKAYKVRLPKAQSAIDRMRVTLDE